MIARFRLVFSVMWLLPFTVLLAPIQLLAIRFSHPLRFALPMFWHRTVSRALGYRIVVQGELSTQRPLLLVSNHISWTDIMVLGAVAPVCFISKHEIEQLPGANWLAKLQRTIFIRRDDKRRAGDQAREITTRLLDGDPMVLFAEGTTADGQRIHPFKSALLGAAKYAAETLRDPVHVQPVAIAYKGLHGMALGYKGRTRAAWTGDQTLGPHALDVMQAGAWDVEVRFGDPIVFSDTTNRRILARQLRDDVRSLYLAAQRNRLGQTAPEALEEFAK